MPKFKKPLKIKETKKTNKECCGISFREVEEMMSGLTPEELNLVVDWLLVLQRNS